MVRRLLGYTIVMAIILGGAVALWAQYNTGMTNTEATMSAQAGPTGMVQSEKSRCTRTCDTLMAFYNQTYPTMTAREGDRECWQTCWNRYGRGSTARATEEIALGPEEDQYLAYSSGPGVVTEERTVTTTEQSMSTTTQPMMTQPTVTEPMAAQPGVVCVPETTVQVQPGVTVYPERGTADLYAGYTSRERRIMRWDEMWRAKPTGVRPEPENQQWFMYNTGEKQQLERTYAIVGASRMKALWNEMRPAHMRANQCAQACWRMHHGADQTVAVGGWRSEPRPYPWLSR